MRTLRIYCLNNFLTKQKKVLIIFIRYITSVVLITGSLYLLTVFIQFPIPDRLPLIITNLFYFSMSLFVCMFDFEVYLTLFYFSMSLYVSLYSLYGFFFFWYGFYVSLIVWYVWFFCKFN